MKIKLWLTNFGWWACGGEEFATLEAAKDAAKSRVGFETTLIDELGEVIGDWSPIGGYRPYRSVG